MADAVGAVGAPGFRNFSYTRSREDFTESGCTYRRYRSHPNPYSLTRMGSAGVTWVETRGDIRGWRRHGPLPEQDWSPAQRRAPIKKKNRGGGSRTEHFPHQDWSPARWGEKVRHPGRKTVARQELEA